MSKPKKSLMEVKGTEIAVLSMGAADHISLTDIARHRDSGSPDDLIRNWLRNRNTIEFLGLWEQLNNPDFNPVEFDGIKMQTGLNSFSLTPKGVDRQNRRRRHHLESGALRRHLRPLRHRFRVRLWISVEFKLYLIKEFQRLKADETARLTEGKEWNLEPHALQNQLPNPHRRHSASHHSRQGDVKPGALHLRRRSRCSKRRALWPDRAAVERPQPRFAGQPARSRDDSAVVGVGQFGIAQRRDDPHGHGTERAHPAAKPKRHRPTSIAARCRPASAGRAAPK